MDEEQGLSKRLCRVDARVCTSSCGNRGAGNSGPYPRATREANGDDPVGDCEAGKRTDSAIYSDARAFGKRDWDTVKNHVRSFNGPGPEKPKSPAFSVREIGMASVESGDDSPDRASSVMLSDWTRVATIRGWRPTFVICFGA